MNTNGGNLSNIFFVANKLPSSVIITAYIKITVYTALPSLQVCMPILWSAYNLKFSCLLLLILILVCCSIAYSQLMLNNMERSKDNNAQAACDWLSPTFTLIDFRKLEFNDWVESPLSPALSLPLK